MAIDQQTDFSGFEVINDDAIDFDLYQLRDYLKSHIAGITDSLQLFGFRGGQSNPTYIMQSGSKRYVIRTKPPGTLVKGAHAVDREYRIMSALANANIPVPRVFCCCRDDTVIGRWFYVMEYVDGRVLWNPALPNFARCERVAIFAAMNRIIADLHSVDYTALGLEDYGRWGGYLQRQVERWGRQYLDQCTQPSTEMRKLIAWLERHVPSLDETTIIHGDYKLENLILYKNNTAVMAVIDWELSTLGHPLADLAFHCMPWHLPPQGFDGLRGLNLAQLGIPTETDYVAEYCRSTGREYIADWNYYLAFNLFRRAAIIQGVITRADKGNASNIHAGKLAERIQPLAERAWELTRNNRDIIAKN